MRIISRGVCKTKDLQQSILDKATIPNVVMEESPECPVDINNLDWLEFKPMGVFIGFGKQN